MNGKLIGALVVAAILAGLYGYILMLKADVSALEAERSDLRAEVARQEELVRNREARIAGLTQVVAVRDQELAAVNGQVAATQKAMDDFQTGIRRMQRTLATAVSETPKPGSVVDEKTSLEIIRNLNAAVLAYGVRGQTETGGDRGAAGGEAEPVPAHLWAGSAARSVGGGAAPREHGERDGVELQRPGTPQ
ncbi:hypothetical protein G3N56_07865 [Desulfovibrio sulfodismutans]|uniref:Uncharacterized protein n=1 Tax=Desulfolutivibrio sulfodismutans TaxID=63561 RepID=A0A7K3NKC4_9BACT|nr:hypothetical protein [Desulfolutivibrio sulfodismutans]NDY56658.1 hypothetical protein [Desulfolutivibrio sulfodismutans]QLA11242.1 hypothetical protein GD606_02595 [Desulfolutivibrio sulfodismutans DSM 3696]